jgi:hypothetical protein
MKTLFLSLVLAALTVGCSSVRISPNLVRQGVATGVRYSVTKFPQAIPGVRVGETVICAAANGTNLNPATVVAQINAAAGPLSNESVLILNSSLILYIGLWESYGSNAVSNDAILKSYLMATCQGIDDGLPPTMGKARMSADRVRWPLVKFR